METMAKQAIDPEDVVFYCRSIIHAIEHQKLRHAKADAPPILAQGTPLFDKAETLPQLQKEFLAILEELEEWIQTYSDERYSRTVSAVLAYVDEHLDRRSRWNSWPQHWSGHRCTSRGSSKNRPGNS